MREIPCEYSRSRNSTPRLQLHFKMQSKRRSPAPSGRLKLTFPAPCLWTVVDSEPWWPCGSWSAGGRAHCVCSILRRLKKEKTTRGIPVIILDSSVAGLMRKEAEFSGADLILTKPFSSTLLRQEIRRLLSTVQVERGPSGPPS